jgi:hypothetical protein
MLAGSSSKKNMNSKKKRRYKKETEFKEMKDSFE